MYKQIIIYKCEPTSFVNEDVVMCQCLTNHYTIWGAHVYTQASTKFTLAVLGGEERKQTLLVLEVCDI